ncbi:MAG: aminotransferase class V-fold PLP-dependent enzyme, partial [bacterium]|nr:aminotransferase class V-fold PLP-dependent enzyme [bacterium]
MVYLDNAATTGHKPEGVIRAVNYALKHYSSNPGRGTYKVSQDSAEMIYNCRSKVKQLFNCSSENRVVFTNNCTESANFVIKGVDIGRNHVIASSLEHNAVTRPLRSIEKTGAQVEFAEVIFDDDSAT